MSKYIPFSQIYFPNQNAKDLLTKLATGKVAFPSSNVSGILLHGAPGNGKSAVAPSFAEEMQHNLDPSRSANVQVRYLRSGGNGTTQLDQLKNQCQVWAAGTYHYQVLNELDQLTPQAMKDFKSLMDDLFGHVVWVFTTNNLDKIDPGLRGRCHVIDYDPVSPAHWSPFIQQKLQASGITMSVAQINNQIIVPGANNLRGIVSELNKLGVSV